MHFYQIKKLGLISLFTNADIFTSPKYRQLTTSYALKCQCMLIKISATLKEGSLTCYYSVCPSEYYEFIALSECVIKTVT